MSRFHWAPYVPVAIRREKALKKMQKLKKKGLDIQPIEIEKRKIANTFWGKAWSDHIESFSDYENRLPRGRTYVRNGSVCHLAIEKGKVSAIVSGSRLYNVDVSIKPLSQNQWKTIKTKCSGKIGSLLELLSGKLSDSVMNIVCHRQEGIFPAPNEINLSCNCPDWAIMCKHVAAVLYGVAARLDHQPDQLFLLRGANHEELIDVSEAITDVTQKAKGKRQRIDDSALADVFGIEIERTGTKKQKSAPHKKKVAVKSENKVKLKSKQKKAVIQPVKPTFPAYLTGASIRKKRKSLGFTQAIFANKIGVSAARISQWERKGRKRLNPKKTTVTKLREIW